MADNPFNTPRKANETPYWLRNGVADYDYIANAEKEHRRRLGMRDGKLATFINEDALAEERTVVDALLLDIAANKIAAPQALAHLNEWRKQHDST